MLTAVLDGSQSVATIVKFNILFSMVLEAEGIELPQWVIVENVHQLSGIRFSISCWFSTQMVWRFRASLEL